MCSFFYNLSFQLIYTGLIDLTIKLNRYKRHDIYMNILDDKMMLEALVIVHAENNHYDVVYFLLKIINFYCGR